MENIKYYRYIYKITCLKGGKEWKNKYYIGQHSTTDINDGYAGSGIKIIEYYSLYGKRLGDTYDKKILKDNIESQEDLDKLEKYYIDKHLGKPKCLNLIEGGLDAIKRPTKQERSYYMDDDNNLISCDKSTETNKTNINTKPKFDNLTEKYLNTYKNNKDSTRVHIKLTESLIKYGLTPSMLDWLYQK